MTTTVKRRSFLLKRQQHPRGRPCSTSGCLSAWWWHCRPRLQSLGRAVDEADKANKLMACDGREIDLPFVTDGAEWQSVAAATLYRVQRAKPCETFQTSAARLKPQFRAMPSLLSPAHLITHTWPDCLFCTLMAESHQQCLQCLWAAARRLDAMQNWTTGII